MSKNWESSQIFMSDGVDIDNRLVGLYGFIDSEKIGTIISGIQLMLIKNKKDPIKIFINSEGGCAYTSLGFYDFLRSLVETEIYTYNIGCAMSGASIILMAGDRRFMYEHSSLMLHSVHSMAKGKVFPDLVPETEECKRIYKDLCRIYEKHSKIPYRKWYSDLKFTDKYYNAEKALELQLIDEIIK